MPDQISYEVVQWYPLFCLMEATCPGKRGVKVPVSYQAEWEDLVKFSGMAPALLSDWPVTRR